MRRKGSEKIEIQNIKLWAWPLAICNIAYMTPKKLEAWSKSFPDRGGTGRTANAVNRIISCIIISLMTRDEIIGRRSNTVFSLGNFVTIAAVCSMINKPPRIEISFGSGRQARGRKMRWVLAKYCSSSRKEKEYSPEVKVSPMHWELGALLFFLSLWWSISCGSTVEDLAPLFEWFCKLISITSANRVISRHVVRHFVHRFCCVPRFHRDATSQILAESFRADFFQKQTHIKNICVSVGMDERIVVASSYQMDLLLCLTRDEVKWWVLG